MLATSGRSCRHGRAAGNKGTTLSGALRKAGTILNTPVVRIQPRIRWAQHGPSRLHPPTPPLASRFAVFQCFRILAVPGTARVKNLKFCGAGFPPPQPPFGKRRAGSRFDRSPIPEPRGGPLPAGSLPKPTQPTRSASSCPGPSWAENTAYRDAPTMADATFGWIRTQTSVNYVGEGVLARG